VLELYRQAMKMA